MSPNVAAKTRSVPNTGSEQPVMISRDFSNPGPARQWAVFLAVLAVVLAFRMLWVHMGAGPLPYWDQWDSEGWLLYRAFQQGELGLAELFSAHNEHRILWPRLTALLLFLGNNQHWDNLVSAGFSAFFVATLVAILVKWSKARIDATLQLPVLLLLLVVFCLPFAWENLVSGFQISFFQLLLFSFLGIGLSVHAKPSWAAAIGLLAIPLAGLFTMASGMFAPAVAGGVLAWRTWRRELPSSWLVLAALLFGISVLGYVLVPPTPHHAGLKAQSVGELAHALFVVLAWPFPTRFPLGIVLWLSPLLWAASLLFRQESPPRLVVFAVAISAWVALQALAMAYSRGHGAAPVSSRYMDLLAIGCVANALLWMWWCRLRLGSAAPSTVVRYGVALLYGALVIALIQVSLDGVRNLTAHRDRVEIQTQNVHAYLATGDMNHLTDRPFLHLPYPDPNRLRMFLDDPHVASMLPGAPRRTNSIEPDSRPSPLTWLSHALVPKASLLLSVVLTGLLALWVGSRLRRQQRLESGGGSESS